MGFFAQLPHMGDSRNDMVLADEGEAPLRERILVE
jgi:hypothetical protein